MSDFKSRLFQEHDELMIRTKKLKEFIVGEGFEKLPTVDRKDLKEQLQHMTSYLNILGKRVSRQCNNA